MICLFRNSLLTHGFVRSNVYYMGTINNSVRTIVGPLIGAPVWPLIVARVIQCGYHKRFTMLLDIVTEIPSSVVGLIEDGTDVLPVLIFVPTEDARIQTCSCDGERFVLHKRYGKMHRVPGVAFSCAFSDCKNVEPKGGKFRHCTRCLTVYCSSECSNSDERHREICNTSTTLNQPQIEIHLHPNGPTGQQCLLVILSLSTLPKDMFGILEIGSCHHLWTVKDCYRELFVQNLGTLKTTIEGSAKMLEIIHYRIYV
jgi:hypothetical protein